MNIGKNYTGKIHATYSVSSADDKVGRAECNQHIVIGSINRAAIDAASESQFCGKCFRTRSHATRKAYALHRFNIANKPGA